MKEWWMTILRMMLNYNYGGFWGNNGWMIMNYQWGYNVVDLLIKGGLQG